MSLCHLSKQHLFHQNLYFKRAQEHPCAFSIKLIPQPEHLQKGQSHRIGISLQIYWQQMTETVEKVKPQIKNECIGYKTASVVSIQFQLPSGVWAPTPCGQSKYGSWTSTWFLETAQTTDTLMAFSIHRVLWTSAWPPPVAVQTTDTNMTLC